MSEIRGGIRAVPQEPALHDEVGLLPCPFCGSPAEIERYGDGRQSTIYQCTFCSCSLETGEEWDHGRDWNKRAYAHAGDEIDAVRRRLLASVPNCKDASDYTDDDLLLLAAGEAIGALLARIAALSPEAPPELGSGSQLADATPKSNPRGQ